MPPKTHTERDRFPRPSSRHPSTAASRGAASEYVAQAGGTIAATGRPGKFFDAVGGEKQLPNLALFQLLQRGEGKEAPGIAEWAPEVVLQRAPDKHTTLLLLPAGAVYLSSATPQTRHSTVAAWLRRRGEPEAGRMLRLLLDRGLRRSPTEARSIAEGEPLPPPERAAEAKVPRARPRALPARMPAAAPAKAVERVALSPMKTQWGEDPYDGSPVDRAAIFQWLQRTYKRRPEFAFTLDPTPQTTLILRAPAEGTALGQAYARIRQESFADWVYRTRGPSGLQEIEREALGLPTSCETLGRWSDTASKLCPERVD